jgi:5-formyltetrahydrofolate cyclo-ligase
VQTKTSLRSELLAARRAVPSASRERAARNIARLVSQTRWLGPGKRIGVYASMPHEVGTAPLIALALARGCDVYLPRITSLRARTMSFVRYNEAGRRHSLGMHEPHGLQTLDARYLDTLFVPAVAVDHHGGRIGHGLGFYDRTLAFRNLREHWRGPRLVGLVYSFQVVPQVPMTANDVFMDTIVTDRGIDELLAHENRTIDVWSR